MVGQKTELGAGDDLSPGARICTAAQQGNARGGAQEMADPSGRSGYLAITGCWRNTWIN